MTRIEMNRISVEALVTGGADRQLARSYCCKISMGFKGKRCKDAYRYALGRIKKMNEKEKLDIIYGFGKDVIIKARDMTINSDFGIIEGTSKAPSYVELHKELANFNNEQKNTVKRLIINSIDGAINNFLWMMEQNNDKYAFTAKCKDGTQFDIEQESDGLCMEQYAFIDEYSKYNDILKILETGKIEKESEQ